MGTFQPTICNFRYYKNETSGGRPSASKARNSYLYYDRKLELGAEEEMGRGQWFSQYGPEPSHEVMDWVTKKAKEHKYTYTLMVSVRDAPLQAEHFRHALGQAMDIDDYRLIAHNDTKHAHAHVMVFRDKTYTHEQFHEIKASVQQSLAQQEQEYFAELKLQAQIQQAHQLKLQQELDNGLDIDDDWW